MADNGGRRVWLAILRGDQLLSRTLRNELADELERQWFPRKGGRPSKTEWTSWQKGNHNVRAMGYRNEVVREVAAMKERGEPGRKDVAIEVVAARHGITARALQDRMKNIPPRS